MFKAALDEEEVHLSLTTNTSGCFCATTFRTTNTPGCFCAVRNAPGCLLGSTNAPRCLFCIWVFIKRPSAKLVPPGRLEGIAAMLEAIAARLETIAPIGLRSLQLGGHCS